MVQELIQKIKGYDITKIMLSETNFKYRVKYIDPRKSLEEYSYIDIPRCFSANLDMSLFPQEKRKVVNKAPDNGYVASCQSASSVLALNEQLKIAIQL